MNDIDLDQLAVVFWIDHPGMCPGQLTRFDHLGDAIRSVMHEPTSKKASVAWIKTADKHLNMDEIRRIGSQLDQASLNREHVSK